MTQILYGIVLLGGLALLGAGFRQIVRARRLEGSAATGAISLGTVFVMIGLVAVTIGVAVLLDIYTRPPQV
jgi:hypothetical protein